MTEIVIAACRMFADLSESNVAFAQALRALGATVRVEAWNSAPVAAFTAADLVVLRQTWDYPLDPGGFAAWAIRAEALGARLENPAAVAIWNNDKRTLRALGAAGIAVPVTVALDDGAATDISAIPTEEVVIKPAFGGGGYGVRLGDRGTLAATLADAEAEMRGPFFAQEYLPEIADGEVSMTCIEGTVAFARLKIPASGEFRVNTKFTPVQRTIEPPADALRQARRILDWLGAPLLHARIDGVMRGERFLCTELELTDPDLSLHAVEGAAERLARATLARVRQHEASRNA